jgi:RHS repeat-associated protein
LPFCGIDYNAYCWLFEIASYIGHNYQKRELFLYYGPDEQRIKTEYKINGQTTLTKYFPGGGLEVEVNEETSEERWLHYLPGGGLYVCDKNFNKIGMYYVLTDCLGSWDKVISETGTTVEEYSFDPCSVKLGFCECSETKNLVERISAEERGREGRRRNPTNWTYTGVPSSFTFNRGYTGHEMLDAFGLVNMNGRMYDPVMGRMLSIDNYVSLPEHTQGYNRYTYALNNPLIITDPSGDNPILLFIAFEGVLNGAMSAQNGDGFLQGFAIGTATAALSYGVGAVIGPVMAGPGAIPGMVNAGVNTSVSGLITYGFEAIVNNSAFNWNGWALNTGMAMAVGGVEGYAEAIEYNKLIGPRPFGEPQEINPFSGKAPYKDVSLEIPFVGQNPNNMDCMLANSEMLEKYYGGTRTIEDFREIFNALPSGATDADYFSAAGFIILGNPENAIHIIRSMEVHKTPTTITTLEGVKDGIDVFHNSTITRVRMWTPKSKAVFWVNDPIRGANYKWTQKDLYKVIWDRFTIGGIK